MKKFLLIMGLALAVSTVIAVQLDIKDFYERVIYRTDTVCTTFGILANGSQTCLFWDEEEVYHYTDYIRDGKIRIGEKVIEIDGFYCINKGEKRIECISLDDGLHKADPEKSFCNPHGGMTCIILEIKDDKTYYYTYIDGKKYDKDKIKWDKLKWI